MPPKHSLRIPQIDASLDKPLNVDAPPTIYGTTLKPEFATAAINLAIDFIKRSQSIANQYLLFHPLTLFTISLFLVTYWAINLVFPTNITATSVSGYLYQFAVVNKHALGSGLLFTVILTSFVFTLLSRVTDTYFKSKINEITEANGETVFGVNLKNLIVKDSEEGKSKQLQNTHIVVYRETPIALVTVSENKALSSPESLVIAISSIGCRKVYTKSGILEDLLDWTMIRTRSIAKEGNYGNSMKILYAVYSFDKDTKQVLKSKGFKLIQAVKVQDNRILGGLFGLKTELWGVQFRIEQDK
ncbi:hypothetical protein TPHA_0B03200 [Tetrapisispora phaffii CBS 4417]|uniref:Uncharacterized protein n=1 Tax=Tetrapisispora phaffii (strain ATCC 24235 / CBS 4417 / NBRC 1672 / NRRL Y-8282 / UCD 70-5) TaxID=1071381 RepID=G8BPR1_TETPH|nr:hypothetical protein TPHA_0B03200 [Tetrapisispora phaffii CBS 4417]CCE61992.1 hypothetical protein TPHA_0B03200 [Tetrapisispora phaffii CBS 4417]